MIRLGVFLLAAQFPDRSQAEVLEGAVSAAVAAEAAGFDDVWVAEHHFMSYSLVPSATTLAGYLLGATRRVAVGTAVSVLSNRHPVALAEEALLLDQVSGGRFRLGVGRGGPWVDLEVFGTGLDRYAAGFGESLELLLAALRGGPVSGRGPRFTFREVPIVPSPATKPHPPVVLACTSHRTAALAAQHRLPMLLGMHAEDAEKAEFVDRYGEAPAGPLGHLSAAVGYVADSRAEASATLRASLPRWLGPALDDYVRIDGQPHRPRDPVAYTELLCRLHPVGSPDDCVRVLADSAERTGIRHMLLMVEGAGDRVRTLENIARFGTEVLPRLH